MCVSRVNYEISRLSKLHEDARRWFQRFSASLVQVGVVQCRDDDMPCKVKKKPGVEKVENFKKSRYDSKFFG